MSRRFEIFVKSLEWVRNDEGTRWFLVLLLEEPLHGGLKKLLRFSNTTAQSYGQLPLYEKECSQKRRAKTLGAPKDRQPLSSSTSHLQAATYDDAEISSFHISVGWTLKAPSPPLIERLGTFVNDVRGLEVPVNAVKIKIGNAISVIPLTQKVEIANRILGN